MKAVVGRLLLLLALAASCTVLFPPPARAQGTLQINLLENPFVCDAIVRPLGTVSGLIPGESVEFSSPQLNGIFSRRVADAAGQVEMRWNCSGAQSWSVTIRGLSSGASTTFSLTGTAAPPPADAPAGAAFDAKTAMTTAQMAIWKDFSPFNTVGVYIPVNTSWDNRADKVQSNLTANWVSTVFADGWRIIPIYVGFQAPDRCATARFEGLSTDPGTARSQGLASAQDAVASVARLGIGPGNPIYYDMEAYRTGCAEAVLAFLDAWTEGLHSAGYISGVYGSRSSTMWDLSRTLGTPGFDAPDAVWVSTGNGRATAYGLEIPADGQWANARMHQYRLGITRTYGGVTREIDENIVNAPLAGPGSSSVPTNPGGGSSGGGGGGGIDSDGDGILEPSPDNCDSVANPDQADLDNDGDGDVCDRDIDGDGVDNVMDFAPRDKNVSAAPQATSASVAQPTATAARPTATAAPAAPATSDVDGDGIADPEPDNCDLIANADQLDLDGDGDGDVCDIDIDGDGVPNDADQDPHNANSGAFPTPTATAEPNPTALPAAPSPNVSPTAEATAGSAAPTPGVTPTVEGQVVVLPTPTPPSIPQATPTPSPTPPTGEAAGSLDESPTTVPDAEPQGSLELASDTVTITVDEESTLLPFGIAALVMFSAFCVSMGVRSYRRGRDVWL